MLLFALQLVNHSRLIVGKQASHFKDVSFGFFFDYYYDRVNCFRREFYHISI